MVCFNCLDAQIVIIASIDLIRIIITYNLEFSYYPDQRNPLTTTHLVRADKTKKSNCYPLEIFE